MSIAHDRMVEILRAHNVPADRCGVIASALMPTVRDAVARGFERAGVLVAGLEASDAADCLTAWAVQARLMDSEVAEV